MLKPDLVRRKDTKNCIFCGSPTNSGEHLFSRWTHPYLPPRAKGRVTSTVSIEYADGRAVHDAQKMPGQMRDWKINCVCGGTKASCNAGWMKDIEDANIPVLRPLILGEQVRLTTAQQRMIATWAVLKTMVANHTAVNPAHLNHMFREHLPPEECWGVWIGHYERDQWESEWLTRLFTVLPEEQYHAMSSPHVDFNNGSSTTFILNKLLVVVAQCPDPQFGHRWNFDEQVPIKSKLRRIWPLAGDVSVRWPPPVMTDEEAVDVTDAIIRGVKRVAKVMLDSGLLRTA